MKQMCMVDHKLAPFHGLKVDASHKLYIPINFWFSKGTAGAALPLIALQYHEVKLIFNIAQYSDCVKQVVGSNTSLGDFSGPAPAFTNSEVASIAGSPPSTTTNIELNLYADFIFLDTAERRRFAQTSHEYLIEQLQMQGMSPVNEATLHQTRLTFNHPCKAFYWTFELDDDKFNYVKFDPFYNGLPFQIPDHYSADQEGLAYKDSTYPPYFKAGHNPIKSVQLKLNGHDRFPSRDGDYFSTVQPYQHHTRVPETYAGMYSFCISPEEHQPSGALNMSRVDNAQLTVHFNEYKDHDSQATTVKGNLYIYAVNYNVLRILSGMGGLAFSN
jgi:hypothetical protein